MIVLDTNIISEMMKPKPDPLVQAWLNEQLIDTLFISTVTQAELLYGIAALTDGRKKLALTHLLHDILQLFQGRILSFDHQAAEHYAVLAVKARQAGKGFPTPDGYIAAIAVSQNFIVATRDESPFAAAELTVINPFLSD